MSLSFFFALDPAVEEVPADDFCLDTSEVIGIRRKLLVDIE